jgi:hypothetical protein
LFAPFENLVDYSSTLREMNIAVASFLIIYGRSLEFIFTSEKHSCRCSKSQHLEAGLASWVPDCM